MLAAMGRRLPLVDVTYPVGLSFLLHGLIAMAVVFAPQWLRAKPFKLPVTYEVTLVAPPGGGGQPPSSPSSQPGPKVAAAQAKAVAPPPPAVQPREVLTLPSGPRPVVPQAAVRSQPSPARMDEMTLPSKRPAPVRRPPDPVASTPPPTVVAARPAPVVAPPVAPIIAPTVAPPPSLAVVRPARVRGAAPPAPVSPVNPLMVIAPRVAAPPDITRPVITAPVITPPKVASSRAQEARSDAGAARPASTPSAVGAQASPSAAQGLGMVAETGVTVGNTDPALAYYFVLIQDKITGNWIPPKMGAGTSAGVSLSLRILRSGQLRDLAIDAPSGERGLDDSALRAVRQSAPLPPLPPLFKAETLYLQLRFTLVGEKS
jgi:TonB family protein